jgi:transposase
LRLVALKREEQRDMQTRHRARDRLVGERTALINQLRAILLERGLVIAQGRRNLERERDVIPCEARGLAVSAAFDEFAARGTNDEAARRLATIPASAY